MNVTLKKDVLTPQNGVGRIGQTVSMSDDMGKQYIGKGLAVEAGPDADVLPPDEAPAPVEPITRDSLKEDKAATNRKTKPDGPAETK